MARGRFYPLTITAVDALTDDSAALSFAVAPEWSREFSFAPGQSLTLRVGPDRRSYSICAAAGQPLRIGVREVAGGAVSGWLVRQSRVGDVIQAQAPQGSFTPVLGHPEEHVLIAAGSGITPLLSIAGSVLAADPGSRVTLLYGNRRADSVMFVEEVADLKNAYPTRMRLVHVLSREAQEVALHNGRLDADHLRTLVPATVVPGEVGHWWLCGPFGLIEDAQQVLTELGVAPEQVHRELFYVGEDPPRETHPSHPVAAGAGPASVVTVVLDGRQSTVRVEPQTALLDGAQRVRPDLPFACKGGVCGTCRALVTHGAVRMRRNYALEPAEVEAGYVLSCQSHAQSAAVTLDFDR